MNYQRSLSLSLLSSCLAFSGFCASNADTTETTQTTTTVTSSNSAVVQLPASGQYVVVDPLTGQIQGKYDPSARLVDGGALRTGVVIVDQANGGPVGFVDASLNIVDVAISPASPTLLVSINTRRQELNTRIDEALNRGALTPAQATEFRAELDRIAADEESDRKSTGVVTYRRALMLGYGLNTLSDRLTPVTNTVVFKPVIAPEFVVRDGRLTLLDAMDFRKHRLATRCDDEYAAGRLSAQNVTRLKEELNKISLTQQKYVKHGALSTEKDRKLSESLDRLQDEMNNDVALINQKRARIGIRAD